MCSPNIRVIQYSKNIHSFINWKKTIITDSGGFQILTFKNNIFSNDIEHGVLFNSYASNKINIFTPETSINIQRKLKADIIIAFDRCNSFSINKDMSIKFLTLTNRWCLKSYIEFKKYDSQQQILYGVIQGGIYSDLRIESCYFITSKDFFGYAIGGTIGDNILQMLSIILIIKNTVFCYKPIHLLGLGKLQDILQSIKLGVDTLDCVHPTRIARHYNIFNQYDEKKEYINMDCIKYKYSYWGLNLLCNCNICLNFSCSYIKHLIKVKEQTGLQLLSIHNITFVQQLVAKIIFDIKKNTFY
jgi:queuine tRNA-ribosyltransferase